MRLAIRSAQASDLAALMAIYNEAIAERIATADLHPRTLADRQEWFKQFDERCPLWVGEQEGKVVCYGALYRYSPREGYRFAVENAVYVASSARGHGFGRQMLEHVVGEAKRLGFRYVWARIFTHNEASLRLHAALGFAEVGVQRRIVEMDGRWYDVTLMDLHL